MWHTWAIINANERLYVDNLREHCNTGLALRYKVDFVKKSLKLLFMFVMCVVVACKFLEFSVCSLFQFVRPVFFKFSIVLFPTRPSSTWDVCYETSYPRYSCSRVKRFYKTFLYLLASLHFFFLLCCFLQLLLSVMIIPGASILSTAYKASSPKRGEF